MGRHAWGDMPGTTWLYEDLYLEQAESSDSVAASPAVEPPPDTVATGGESLCPTHRTIFGPSPEPDINEDDAASNSLPPSSGGVEAPSSETGMSTERRRMNSSGRLPTVIESTPAPEEPAGRILRKVRSSKLENSSTSKSHARKPRLRKQGHPSLDSIEQSSPTRQDGSLLEPHSGDAEPSSAAP